MDERGTRPDKQSASGRDLKARSSLALIQNAIKSCYISPNGRTRYTSVRSSTRNSTEECVLIIVHHRHKGEGGWARCSRATPPTWRGKNVQRTGRLNAAQDHTRDSKMCPSLKVSPSQGSRRAMGSRAQPMKNQGTRAPSSRPVGFGDRSTDQQPVNYSHLYMTELLHKYSKAHQLIPMHYRCPKHIEVLGRGLFCLRESAEQSAAHRGLHARSAGTMSCTMCFFQAQRPEIGSSHWDEISRPASAGSVRGFRLALHEVDTVHLARCPARCRNWES